MKRVKHAVRTIDGLCALRGSKEWEGKGYCGWSASRSECLGCERMRALPAREALRASCWCWLCVMTLVSYLREADVCALRLASSSPAYVVAGGILRGILVEGAG